MFAWLRKMFCRQKRPDDLRLTIMWAGKHQKVIATGVSGMHLTVQGPDFFAVVSRSQSKDRKQFDRLWKYLGGDNMGLHWQDGTPYKPEE